MTQTWIDATGCDRRVFRDMLGSFMTGVTVVATRDAQGAPRAFTANSFSSVSLDPPLVLVCLAKSAGSYDAFMEAGSFSISVLGDWQRETSNAFASRTSAKVEAMGKLIGDDTPYVEESLATIICERDRLIDAGDHVILLGAVRRFQSAGGQPLGYFRGGYVGFGMAVRQLEQIGAPLRVCGLLERGGRVMLCRRPGATRWEIPGVPLSSGENHSTLLRNLFARLEIPADASLLYSLFQEAGERSTTMVFSVETSADVVPRMLEDGTEIGLFTNEDRPWEMIEGEMMSGMLLRYFRERAAGCFGIYYDTSDGGRVVALDGKPRPWSEWRPHLADAHGLPSAAADR